MSEQTTVKPSTQAAPTTSRPAAQRTPGARVQQTAPGEKKPLTKAQLKKRQKKIHTWTRVGIQIVFFLLAPSLFTESFNGVKRIFTTIGSGGVLEWNAFIRTMVILCAFTMLLGRFFCGYACAFGAVGDWVYALSDKVQTRLTKKRKKKTRLPEVPVKVQHWLQYVKYLVLAIIVLLCALGVYGSLSGWSPWDVFSMLRARNLRLSGYALGVFLLILIVVGMAWKERFFCQYLCPMGAVFALLPVLPLTSLRRKRESCVPRCSACEKQCPTAVALDVDAPRTGECIRCGKCVGTCPKGNISTGVPGWKGDEWWIMVIEALVLLLLVKL